MRDGNEIAMLSNGVIHSVDKITIYGAPMHFYVDESGHTGPNLFDPDQPMLYYGVLSSKLNVDAIAEPPLQTMRKALGVDRLHANVLGNGGLVKILPNLIKLQRQLDFKFDLYRVAKPDHAVICFFDQVFDSGVNPAMTWTGYWTPLRYMALIKVAHLFDENLAIAAWEARISLDTKAATAQLQAVCRTLMDRLVRLPDARSRELFGDVLTWAINHPGDIGYNVHDKHSRLQILPNIVGFQSVMHGIAARIKATGRDAVKIVVDQQSQFNKAQKTLADFYASAREIEWAAGPGMPVMDLKNMPQVPIVFSSGKASAGLELVDIQLWVFKRFMEDKELAPELFALIKPHLYRGRTDEISLAALEKRWTAHFAQVPELHEMSPDQIACGAEILRIDEARRMVAVHADRDAEA
jgi:hypothetical protein